MVHFENKKSLENQGFFDFWKSYRVLIENPSGGFTCPLGEVQTGPRGQIPEGFKVNDCELKAHEL